MTTEEKIALDSYYLEIENINELYAHISPVFPSDNISDGFLFFWRIEEWARSSKFDISVIDQLGYQKNDVVDYLISRIDATSNIIQKGNYYRLIYLIKKNEITCKKAIDCYQQVLNSSFDNTQKEYYESNTDEIFEQILELSQKIKYQLPELKKQIAGYLSDDAIADSLKTRLFLSVKERNPFRSKESESFSQKFISIAESCNDTYWVEQNLELALFFASKSQNKQLIQSINELLGDNKCKDIFIDDDNNAAIPHLNENIFEEIISYYKKAKCKEKEDEIWELHQKNKANKQYFKIESSVEVSKEEIDALKNNLVELLGLPTNIIIILLVLGKKFLFIPNDILEKQIKDGGIFFYEQFFTPVQVDINGNHKISDPYENKKFMYYGCCMGKNIDYIFDSILTFIHNKKISFKKVQSFLAKRTSFGVEFSKKVSNSSYSYTWYSLVDIGIESYFAQCNRLIKGKPQDWRVCIDVLTPKFEGILRDILFINGATITKLKDGNTVLITLEDIIRPREESIKTAFYKSFNDDDLNLFQYVFSSIAQCHNIRNNVAHCYYLPVNYSHRIATLVLLCILRLAKFVPRNNTNLI